MTAISHNFSGYLWLSIYTYWPSSISWDDDVFHGSPGCGGRTWKTPWWSMRRHHGCENVKQVSNVQKMWSQPSLVGYVRTLKRHCTLWSSSGKSWKPLDQDDFCWKICRQAWRFEVRLASDFCIIALQPSIIVTFPNVCIVYVYIYTKNHIDPLSIFVGESSFRS